MPNSAVKPLILVVEDDPAVRNLIVAALEAHGLRHMAVETAHAAIAAASSQAPSIVLLDLGLPDMDGVKVVESVRTWSGMPIIVVSARSEDADKIRALDAGADDYLTKPIKMKLLVSRVQAILKRIDADKAPEKAPSPGITVDRERYTVIRDGQEITLPRKEFALLDLLYSSPGKLIPREEIYARIWGTEVVVGDRTIDVHIRKLRQKIGDERIVTVKGVGYKYEPV